MDEGVTFAACLATVLELPRADVPPPASGHDPTGDWRLSRWLGGMGVGLVPVADVSSFSWAGPWLARVERPGILERTWVVMYGVPSGVVWDPSGATQAEGWTIDKGAVVALGDVATALASRPPRLPMAPGVIDSIWVAPAASQPARRLDSATALEGEGLDGDRHVRGTGTFPSGLPGSALTLIEGEVCDSFSPPLGPNEHRRNVVTRGIDLNALVGRDFMLGSVRCRGMRLCEPCRVVAGYAGRPILRALVHRGGLRADILVGGTIRIGDAVVAVREDSA